jgi:hypothetical protein
LGMIECIFPAFTEKCACQFFLDHS